MPPAQLIHEVTSSSIDVILSITVVLAITVTMLGILARYTLHIIRSVMIANTEAWDKQIKKEEME